MRTAIILFSTLLLVWIGGSSYIYVCKIRKDCCCAEKITLTDSLAMEADSDSSQAANKAPEIPSPGMLTLNFDFNKTECIISAENKDGFESIKQYIAANTSKKVQVTGHSDNIGSEKAKEKIAAKRADFVKQKLTETGIASESIVTASENDHKPVADNTSKAGRAQNRRVEILIQ